MDPWTVIDLFSGCGGMSYGFHARNQFRLVAAVDAQVAKPCEKMGRLNCNSTYALNMGIEPLAMDVFDLTPDELLYLSDLRPGDLTVLIACPPCTDFSRAKPTNHTTDTRRNTLVGRAADFVETLMPEFVVMENVREMIMGRNAHHYLDLRQRFEGLGYAVSADIHFLTRFGLPQIRERALIVASRIGPVSGLHELWEGWSVKFEATTVRHAIGWLNEPPIGPGEANPIDPAHQAPGMGEDVRRRIAAIPHDGGSWADIAERGLYSLLTPSMYKKVMRGDLGSYPDVYGRMAWNWSAPTIKRECRHVGNGRYAHPEQDRSLTLREISILQGFPRDYRFDLDSANSYRHVGDAVPPLISYQLSALVTWMKTGVRPRPSDWILPGSSLAIDDIVPTKER